MTQCGIFSIRGNGGRPSGQGLRSHEGHCPDILGRYFVSKGSWALLYRQLRDQLLEEYVKGGPTKASKHDQGAKSSKQLSAKNRFMETPALEPEDNPVRGYLFNNQIIDLIAFPHHFTVDDHFAPFRYL